MKNCLTKKFGLLVGKFVCKIVKWKFNKDCLTAMKQFILNLNMLDPLPDYKKSFFLYKNERGVEKVYFEKFNAIIELSFIEDVKSLSWK